MDKRKRQLVVCSVCKSVVTGRIPRGGDRSALYPHKHRSATFANISECNGYFIEALTLQEYNKNTVVRNMPNITNLT